MPAKLIPELFQNPKSWSLLPHLAVISSVIMLGLSFVAVRTIMMDSQAPATLGLFRYGVAAFVFLPFILPIKRWRLPAKVISAIIFLGALQFGLHHFFVNTALQEIPASRGAVIFALIPILTMLIASIAGQDSLTGMKIAGALISLIGVALAIGEKAFVTQQSSSWLGEILFLLAVTCGATYNALSAGLLRDYPFVPLTALAMAAGALTLFPMALFEAPIIALSSYSNSDWLWFGYLAIPAGALGFYLFNYGLRNLSPSRASIWVPLSPVSAAFFGFLILDEHLSNLFLVGLACTVGGALLVNWRGR